MVDCIQDHLEAIYGIRCEQRAVDYLLDTASARALGATGRSNEELLIKEEDGNLWVGLYLAPDLLGRIESFHPSSAHSLLEEDLSPYCQVAEGVSHFMYLVHSAGQGRSVSLLELEAQAEIDKFASCLFHGWKNGAVRWAEELYERLFERISYIPSLSSEETWRYQEANRMSRAFCQRLMPHVEGRRMDKLLADLRYVYRLGAEAKLGHLTRAP